MEFSARSALANARADTATSPPPRAPPRFTPIGNQASLRRLQAKLTIGAVDDPLEHEADAVAEQVMRLPDPVASTKASTPRISRKCASCDEDERLQTKAAGADVTEGAAPASVEEALGSPGQPLDAGLRGFFKSRFATDFSDVRVHHDDRAARSARDVGARAYTVGKDLVFSLGAYAPKEDSGRRLVAHELAHVVQQRPGGTPQALRRQGGPGEVSASAQAQIACVVREGGCASSRDGGLPSADDIKRYNQKCASETQYAGPDISPTDEQCRNPTGDLAVACTNLETDCRATTAYGSLADPDKKLAEDIIATLGKKAVEERLRLLGKLKTLFDTPVKPPATITAETNASTQGAATQEQARLNNPAEAANAGIEEAGSKDPARKWTKMPGQFGGNYWVDNTSAAHIFVKAEVFLHPAGTGTDADVAKVKSMEDAIEKAASAPGYSVDIIFVNAPTADSFNVMVNPGKWEVADNWAGGAPLGYAHELHHLMAFKLDKYNYIDSHSTNQSMEVAQRLVWFRKELDKPAGYNDPTSIMWSAPHPNDTDACTVAGLDPTACAAARQKARQP